MGTVVDIISNFEHNKSYDKYKQLLDDLSDFDYDKDWVNAPSAYGDTYKFTAEYTIGDFQFKYYHILPEGEIESAKFSIAYDEDEEVLFTYTLLGAMISKLEKSKEFNPFKLT